jgi:HK97 family phage portal protein
MPREGAQLLRRYHSRGNAFGVITQRDPKLLYPTQVVPVHNDDVQVIVRNKTSNLPGTGSIIYKVGGEVVPIDNMMHIRNISSPGSLLGMNPIQYARHTFGLAIATERYGEYFFSNSAEPSGVIEVSGDLSEEETIKLARAWMSKHQGASKAHMPAVLTGGAQYKPIGLNPDDAQFLTTRDFQRQDIISFFRIPEHVLSIVDRTTSWGTGIEQMEMGFVRNTLLPYIRRIETALSQLLPKTMYARFDLSHRLRGDTLQRYQAYTLGRNGGWLCSDEIRAAEEMDPLPDGKGQNFLQPLNMGTLGEQGAMEDNSSTKTVGA